MERKEFIRIDKGDNVKDEYRGIYSIYVHCYERETYGIISFDIDGTQTLAEIFKGNIQIRASHLSYKGKECTSEEFAAFMREKTSYIDRTPAFSEALSIVDNVYVSKKMSGITNRQKEFRELAKTLAFFEIPISLNTPVNELDPLEIYELELIRAYLCGKECVVIDFNTRTIPYKQFAEFRRLMRMLEKEGMTFIWLDINVKRVSEICDALMIFYRRKTARMLGYGPFEENEIIKYIPEVRNETNERKLEKSTGQVIFELRNIVTRNLGRMNLKIHKGEMCTVFCRKQNEIEELLEVLRGNQTCEGEMLLLDEEIGDLPLHKRIDRGICFVELEDNLIEVLNVFDNMCISRGGKVNSIWRNRRFKKSIIDNIDRWIGKDTWNLPVYKLSDEQKIKLIYYRWMLYRPKIVFILNPFSTLDESMNEWIKYIIHEFARNDIAVVSFVDYEFGKEKADGTAYLLDKSIREL